MSLYEYHGIRPNLGKNCFIADGAIVIGNVLLGDDVNIWFNAVVRGDMAQIKIGDGTNIQDLCMLHVDFNIPLTIGKGVTVGHNAILHGCTVDDNALIGMGAQVLDRAYIGKNSIVAAGAIVPPGKSYPANSLIIGAPAIVKRELTKEEIQMYGNQFKLYLKEKTEYSDSEIVKKLNGK